MASKSKELYIEYDGEKTQVEEISMAILKQFAAGRKVKKFEIYQEGTLLTSPNKQLNTKKPAKIVAINTAM